MSFYKEGIMKIITLGMSLLTLLSIPAIQASSLVYSPNNIAFGGLSAESTRVLMSKAKSQDRLKDPDAVDPFAEKSELERFSESLKRRILDILAGQVLKEAFGEFGEGGLGQGGSFSTDEFSVNVDTSNPDIIVVGITDLLGGGETIIEIPHLAQ